MGRRGTTRQREPSDKETEIVATVDGLFTALRWGLVTLPRFLHHDNKAIMALYSGRFDLIEQSIARVEQRTDIVEAKPQDSPIVTRFKGGLAGHYLNILTTLKAYRELLTEYWRIVNVSRTPIGFKQLGDDIRQHYQILGREGGKSQRYYRELARERI